jgi:hypothetical protein
MREFPLVKQRKQHHQEATMTTFDEAVTQLAVADGVQHLISVPGIWECLSDYYNNDALALLREAEEPEEEEEDDDEDLSCLGCANLGDCDLLNADGECESWEDDDEDDSVYGFGSADEWEDEEEDEDDL